MPFVREHLLRRVMPIYWHRANAPWPRELRGGSCFAVRTSSELFGVTAAHVIRAFEVDSQRSGPLIIQLCGATFNIEAALRDVDDEMDVATFSLAEADLHDMGREPFNVHDEWPPPEPHKGEMVALIGFPEVTRGVTDERVARFEAYAAFELISDIGPRELLVVYDPQLQTYVPTEPGLPPIDLNLSGASGGPVVLYRMDKIGTLSCWPVALIAGGKGTYSEGQSANFAMIRCRRIDRIIGANGRIIGVPG
jgi:hypothetical protein